jgi:hypothetical protein
MSEPLADYCKVIVVCEDPRHARGKVAKIDTFNRFDGMWITRSDGAPSTLEEYRRPDDPAGPVWGSARWRRAGSTTGHSRRRYKCKLCGTVLECTEGTLHWLLNTVAAQGISQPTLHQLNLLVSRRR